jgi:hypothetical protein
MAGWQQLAAAAAGDGMGTRLTGAAVRSARRACTCSPLRGALSVWRPRSRASLLFTNLGINKRSVPKDTCACVCCVCGRALCQQESEWLWPESHERVTWAAAFLSVRHCDGLRAVGALAEDGVERLAARRQRAQPLVDARAVERPRASRILADAIGHRLTTRLSSVCTNAWGEGETHVAELGGVADAAL